MSVVPDPATRAPVGLHELPPPPPGRRGWPWTEASAPAPLTLPSRRPWPRITIVTPSYNQAEFLEEALRSVLLQGYPNLEYIVMDGGSGDGSAAIIERYAPWLSHWQSQHDGGQAAALAAGFARSSGAILAWINSDDRLQPGALQRVAHFFDLYPRVVFGSGDVNFIDVESRVTARVFALPPRRIFTARIGEHRWPQQGCFWRREAYERAGGVDASLRFCMDRDLFIRLTAQGPARRIPGPPLGDFREHEAAKSTVLLPVAAREAGAITRKYGGRVGHAQYTALRLGWWLWEKQSSVRRRVQRAYGWEL